MTFKPVRDIEPDDLDMRTIIFILSPKARERTIGGRKVWIEARGYGSETGTTGTPTVLGQFLVLGGTTEGREVAGRLLEQGYTVTVSVTRDEGTLSIPKGANVMIGARDASGWASILSGAKARDGFLGVIDATHPFAVLASREINNACEGTETPLCRFVRAGEVPENAVVVSGVENAIDRAIKKTSGADVIFLALGTNDLDIVVPRVRKSGRGLLVRMLPTARSIKQAERAGLTPMEIIAAWGAGSADLNSALCRERNVKCIVSRDSGVHGHVPEKAAAAKELGIPFILIARPAEPGVTCVEEFDKLIAWCRELAPPG